MRLYVLRHGKAREHADSGRDQDRELKPRGVRQAQHLGALLANAVTPPEIILASGLVRARDTADVVARALGLTPVHEPRLETDHAASDHLEAILAHAATHHAVAVVGHNPTLCELIGVLAKGLGSRDASLRTGEAVVMDINPDQPIGTATVIERLRLEEPVGAC